MNGNVVAQIHIDLIHQRDCVGLVHALVRRLNRRKSAAGVESVIYQHTLERMSAIVRTDLKRALMG